MLANGEEVAGIEESEPAHKARFRMSRGQLLWNIYSVILNHEILYAIM